MDAHSPSESYNTSLPKSSEVNPVESEVKDLSPSKPESVDFEALLTKSIQAVRNDNLELAVELAALSVEEAAKVKGDLNPDMYRFYYHYADAVIKVYEFTQGNKIFGDAVPDKICYSDEEKETEEAEQAEVAEVAKETEQAKEAEETEEGETAQNEEEEDEDKNSQEEEDIEEEEVDDLQMAWENLEMSRVLLEKHHSDIEYLYKTYMRLGDLQSWKENFGEALEEYSKAINITYQFEGDAPTRRKAEVFFLLGNTCLLQAGKEKEAFHYFTQALEVLNALKESAQTQDELADIQELIKEITIKRDDATEQEESLNTIKTSQVLTEPEVGFGQPKTSNEVKDLGIVRKRAREAQPESSSSNPINLPEENETKRFRPE